VHLYRCPRAVGEGSATIGVITDDGTLIDNLAGQNYSEESVAYSENAEQIRVVSNPLNESEKVLFLNSNVFDRQSWTYFWYPCEYISGERYYISFKVMPGNDVQGNEHDYAKMGLNFRMNSEDNLVLNKECASGEWTQIDCIYTVPKDIDLSEDMRIGIMSFPVDAEGYDYKLAQSFYLNDIMVTPYYGSLEDGVYDSINVGVRKAKTAICRITVVPSMVPVSTVTLNKTSATLEIGDTETLTATVNPTNATNKNITWTSSNNSVATVSNGLVTAVGEGVADITVTTEDGDKTAVCTVTVNKVPPLDANAIFTIDNVSARPGDTVKVKIYLSTEEAINTIGLSGFTYDSGVLTFVGFCDHEELDNKAILKSYDNEKCILTVALNETKKYDGYLCSLEFKVNDNAAEGKNVISAQSIVKNTGLTVVSDVVSGGITVRHQMLGDLDGNESVDIDDAVLLLQYSLFPDAYPIDYTGNIDFDKNDSIDIDDAVLLLQYSLFPDAYPLE